MKEGSETIKNLPPVIKKEFVFAAVSLIIVLIMHMLKGFEYGFQALIMLYIGSIIELVLRHYFEVEN